MGQVNRIPNGFLDLLGVQSLGRNPPLFSDAISPVADLTDFYAAQTLSTHTENFVHGAIGDQVVVFVPEGETWFLKTMSFYRSAVTVGRLERWVFLVDNLPREGTGGATDECVLYVTRDQDEDGVSGTDVAASFVMPTPYPLVSGCALKARIVNRGVAGNRTTEFTWSFYRFKN